MDALLTLRERLSQEVRGVEATWAQFYKTGPGQYAEGDRFMGVPVPALRKIARMFGALPLHELQQLIESPFNEERLLALFITINRYEKSDAKGKTEWHQFYMRNLKHVNNWNLVDASAHKLLGAHLTHLSDRGILCTLANARVLWERRIAIVATWFFIKNDDLEWTFRIAKLLLKDPQDLIHKAVGWMLREAGKRDLKALIGFLERHHAYMPRTMLRYALERCSEEERISYLVSQRHGRSA